MAYYDEHDPEDEAKVGGVWLKGHQDHGGEFIASSLSKLPLRPSYHYGFVS